MGAERISQRFSDCAAEGRAAFVGYLMACDPDEATSLAAADALIRSGADVLELGAPFTDPMADGPAIQKAALRSLAAGGTLTGTLRIAQTLRERFPETPIVVMGYANPVHSMGYAAFADAAAEAGVDGVNTVDLPPEEDSPLRAELSRHGLAVIRLATPTSTDARMQRIADGASGFVYYVSVAGVTGAGTGEAADVASGVRRAREASGLPVAVGFGVRTPEQASRMALAADGVVVGSALVEEIRLATEEGTPAAAPERIAVLAGSLSSAIRSARRERSKP